MIFSIIMPVYNKAQYIEKAVNSVLSQKHLKELIAIDDGSTDGCGEILDKLAKKDKRLIVIHQDNKGVSAARNRAIEIINGEYVCFCDADDTLQPNFLEKAYSEITTHLPDIAFFAYASQMPNGSIEYTPSPFQGVTDKKEALSVLYDYQIKTGYFGLVTNKLTKSDIVKRCRFDSSIKLAEDWDFWVQIMQIADKCLFSQTASFTYYKELPGSSCYKAVDYPSQLMLRLRYKVLLNSTVPQLDTKHLDTNISHYVYFSAASSCVSGIKEARETLNFIFNSGYNRKEIYYKGLPFFHRLCLLLIKKNISIAALTMIKAKLLLKGQKNV